MPKSVRAHLATQSLENLAMLADRAVAAEKDIDEAKPGVAEIQVSESGKLVGLLEDLSRRLKKLETATAAKKKTYTDAHKQLRIVPLRHSLYLAYKQNRLYLINQNVTRQNISTNNKKDSSPNAPPPQTNAVKTQTQQNNSVQPNRHSQCTGLLLSPNFR